MKFLCRLFDHKKPYGISYIMPNGDVIKTKRCPRCHELLSQVVEKSDRTWFPDHSKKYKWRVRIDNDTFEHFILFSTYRKVSLERLNELFYLNIENPNRTYEAFGLTGEEIEQYYQWREHAGYTTPKTFVRGRNFL